MTHLNHALEVSGGPCATVGAEWKDAFVVGHLGLLQLLLGLPHCGDLGVGVQHSGDGVVVDVPCEAGLRSARALESC